MNRKRLRGVYLMSEIAKTSKRGYPILLISFLLASFMLAMIFQTLVAQEQEAMPPDLTGSSKVVDQSEALPGSQLQYTVVISNSGDLPAYGVSMTDTLISEMRFVPGSLSVTGGGLFGENSGVITWTGAVNNGAEIAINFEAVLTDTISPGEVVTNTARVAHEGVNLKFAASTNIISETDSLVYLPMISQEPPTVYLFLIGRPTSSNEWTLNWSVSSPLGVTGYEIQEDSDPGFPSPTTYETGPSPLAFDIQLPITSINVYYYRVRAVGDFGSGLWSVPRAVVVNYRDDFNDPGTGWTMRREDTDHIENQTRYENGVYVHEMDSSWDYLISGPLVVIPEPPYRLEMRASHYEPGNLNSYGMVFGGDWDGQTPCPVSDFSTCFNEYYRLNIIWFGDSNHRLRVILKRIDKHEPENNHGRGSTLIGAIDVSTQGQSSSFQKWAVEVYPDGTIKIFINDNFIAQTVDTNYIDRPYFGTFSSTDEYAGLEARFDWYSATALP